MRRVATSLVPGGRFAWNAFVFDPAIAAEIGGVWRDENGIRNRSTYDCGRAADRPRARERRDGPRSGGSTATNGRRRSPRRGLEVEALYGWFDRRPFDDDEPRVRLGRAEAVSDGALRPDRGDLRPWSASVTEDVEFYVEEAVASGGPVVELAVGTGRIAVPIAQAGSR